MVVPSRLRYYFILLTAFFALSLYFTITQEDKKFFFREIKPQGLKRIVGFSLLKQLEDTAQEVKCKEGLKFQDKEEQKLEGGWKRIGNFYIYSVHFDNRLDPFNFVRIVGTIEGSWNQSLYCHLSSSPGSYHVTKATVIPIWSQIWEQNASEGYHNPVLVSCRVPSTVPQSISVSSEPCILSNMSFGLELEPSQRNYFTVCLKPLNFKEDISKKLVQWIEINSVLGAGKFQIYFGKIHPKTRKVLEWYKSNFPDRIVLKEFVPLKSQEQKKIFRELWQKRRFEVVVYNECFYNNINNSKYVVPLDLDEIIVPKNNSSWREVLEEAANGASYTVQNAYYLKEFNKDFSVRRDLKDNSIFFFENMIRSSLSARGESGKSFMSTENALTIFNHYALEVLRPGVLRNIFLPEESVQLNHYRKGCSSVILPECNKILSSPHRFYDPSIYKYKNHFYKRYFKVIKDLKSFGFDWIN